MSFLGGAFEGLDATARVRLSMMRDFNLRFDRAVADGRFDPAAGYRYRGSADLLLKHGVFWPGRVLPDAYEQHRGAPNECYWNALEAAKADPALAFVEGVYTCGYGHARSHAWCIAPDGGVVELTMPTRGEELAEALNELQMPFLPPERWGYYGVTIAVSLVERHADRYGMPLFDRSPFEIEHARQKYGGGADGEPFMVVKTREAIRKMDFSEPHDFPLLKVPYDPNRKELS